MTFNEYISEHHLFTKKDLLKNMDSEYSANRQLQLAFKSNKVIRICQGFYASNFDKYHEKQVNFLQIPQALNPNAILCYAGATNLYGLQHNRLKQIYYYSQKKYKAFYFDGLLFHCIKMNADRVANIQSTKRRNDGVLLNVTTFEQTIIDCLDKTYRNGGFEETIRSLLDFPYIDEDAMKALLSDKSNNLIAKVG